MLPAPSRYPSSTVFLLSLLSLSLGACSGDKDGDGTTSAETTAGGDDAGGDEDGGADSSGDDGGGEGGDDGGRGEEGADWTAPEGGEVQLTTEDDITLVADYYPVDQEGASAVVLLHMIPPNWDRSSWPSTFITDLTAQGWAVLVPDRRGAGDSGGVASEAYDGPQGKYDAAACVDRLQADGYGSVAIIGASNGTTTALDYTLWAAAEGRTQPVGLGFMTGGRYTETNNRMDDLAGTVPAVFTYSTDERAWSVDQQDFGHSAWTFHEYASGDHGTLMFAAAPEVQADLITFLSGVL